MRKWINLALCHLLLLSACGSGQNQGSDVALTQEVLPIEQEILYNDTSFYYIDFKDYGELTSDLKIGVFDSGTGGLTVLDALVRYDQYHNANGTSGADGVADFHQEEFIYLADQANMPYGNYYATGKSDLLIEHIIKDAQFLLGNTYYAHAQSQVPATDKSRIKALVIACNTATAYGQEYIDDFIRKTGLQIPVIGVINAGSRGTLAGFEPNEDGSIGIFATVGTIASKGYDNTILQMMEDMGYTGNIQLYTQGGHGVAEAVDEEPDFIDRSARSPRENYRGPALQGDYAIDRTLMDVYDFDFDHNKMLCDTRNTDDCTVLQINSADNYMRYHLVSLMEKIRNTPDAQPLKALILGCTHYPYLTREINDILDDLYHYQRDGRYVYRDFMVQDVRIIDPAVYVAKELFEALDERNLFNQHGKMSNSEFFISVPNLDNPGIQVDEAKRFTYDYKYGRNAGEIQEYVKVVPFDKTNIPLDIVERFRSSIPETFQLIVEYNTNNLKMEQIAPENKIQ